ncbi:MAG: potassium-transporting ATPase subunit KdpC [Candidatus Sericytochromatia bacterium]
MLWIACRLFATLTLLTGVAYPLAVTGLGQMLWKAEANGSVASLQGRPVGSALLAQKFVSPRYLWPRPSAGDYGTVASGASNKGPTSRDLQQAVAERAAALRTAHGLSADASVPSELLLASGSGLDPHLSPAAVRFQLGRLAQTRQLDLPRLEALLRTQTEAGVLGSERVNVLRFNLALDALQP